MHRIEQLLLKPGGGKEPARTPGQAPGDIAVQPHPAGGYSQLTLQPSNEADQRRKLPLRRGSPVAVADKADRDGVRVVFVGLGSNGMPAGELPDPTLADVECAITHSVAVADEEMEAHHPVAMIDVEAADGLGVAGWLA